MTGSTSKRSLPICTAFYGTEIKIQNTDTNALRGGTEAEHRNPQSR